MDRAAQRAWGRIGGLVRASRYSADEMLAPARAGFRARFEREVAEAAALRGETLSAAELKVRADRLVRAHMLGLAQASAAARRKAAP